MLQMAMGTLTTSFWVLPTRCAADGTHIDFRSRFYSGMVDEMVDVHVKFWFGYALQQAVLWDAAVLVMFCLFGQRYVCMHDSNAETFTSGVTGSLYEWQGSSRHRSRKFQKLNTVDIL